MLFRDGRAELKSKDRPDQDFEYTGSVDFWNYGRLCYLTQWLHIDGLAEHYSANWTDGGGATIRVKLGDREVVVSEYSGIGPIELWALQSAIDLVQQHIQWKPR